MMWLMWWSDDVAFDISNLFWVLAPIKYAKSYHLLLYISLNISFEIFFSCPFPSVREKERERRSLLRQHCHNVLFPKRCQGQSFLAPGCKMTFSLSSSFWPTFFFFFFATKSTSTQSVHELDHFRFFLLNSTNA